MIKIIKGDIFSGTEDIICHQVNTFGVMGSGIALQIKKLYPDVYMAYHLFCKRYGDRGDLLGCVLPEMATKHRCIMNMFSITIDKLEMRISLDLSIIQRYLGMRWMSDLNISKLLKASVHSITDLYSIMTMDFGDVEELTCIRFIQTLNLLSPLH
jgi:hypothetical protein